MVRFTFGFHSGLGRFF